MKGRFALIPVMILFLTLTGICPAQEVFLSREQLQETDRDREVFLGGVLDDGGLILISQEPGREMTRLMLVSPRGSVARPIDIPIRGIEYVVPFDNGRKALIYTSDRYSFFVVDLRRRRWKKVHGREGSEPGFALFGGRKSWLFPMRDKVLAWGYFYDRGGEYASEWLVSLDTSAQGEEFINRQVEMTRLMDSAREMIHGGGSPGVMKAGGDIFAFVIENEHGGGIFTYNIKKNELNIVEQFSAFHGMDVSPDGSKCAYAITPRGGTRQVLFIYDINRQVSMGAHPGDYYNPVFDRDGRTVAVGSRVTALGRVMGTTLHLFSGDTSAGEAKKIQVLKTGAMVDWKFAGRNQLIIISRQGDIYREKY